MAVNLLAKFTCAECSEVFNEQEDICEDWAEKDKSLICPNCLSYLVIYQNYKRKYVWYAAALGFFIGSCLAVINGAYIAPIVLAVLFSMPLNFLINGDPFEPRKTVLVKRKKYNNSSKKDAVSGASS